MPCSLWGSSPGGFWSSAGAPPLPPCSRDSRSRDAVHRAARWLMQGGPPSWPCRYLWGERENLELWVAKYQPTFCCRLLVCFTLQSWCIWQNSSRNSCGNTTEAPYLCVAWCRIAVAARIRVSCGPGPQLLLEIVIVFCKFLARTSHHLLRCPRLNSDELFTRKETKTYVCCLQIR